MRTFPKSVATFRVVFAAAMLPFVVYLAACSSGSHSPTSHPPNVLLGRWQSQPTLHHLYARFEFFQDGTVVEGVFKPTTQKLEELSQCATGTFRFIDPAHLEIHVLVFHERRCPYWSAEPWSEKAGPQWFYELDWLDDDHVRLVSGEVGPFGLQTGGETIELNRLN